MLAGSLLGKMYASSSNGTLYFRNNAGTIYNLLAAATPAGNNTEVQYNSVNNFGSSTNFKWADGLGRLEITGSISGSQISASIGEIAQLTASRGIVIGDR